jgi:hypothetical protein
MENLLRIYSERHMLGCGRTLSPTLCGWHTQFGSHLDDVVSHGIQNQLADGMQSKLSHDIAAVSFGSLNAQIEMTGHFFGRPALGK